MWLLLGRPGRPGGGPPPPGPRLSQVDDYAVVSLASPVKCKSISEIEKQPLGTVPRPTGQLPSWTNGCFRETLFDKSAFDQMFRSREIFSAKSEDGAEGWLSASARPERFLWIEPFIKAVTILVNQMLLLKEVKILFLTARCIRS